MLRASARCCSTNVFSYDNILADSAVRKAVGLRLSDVKSLRPPVHSKREPSHAVLVPLCKTTEGVSLLYTVRSRYMRAHRRQVSFPGGAIDDSESPVEAALRETQEELGVEPDRISIWGMFPGSLSASLDAQVVPILASIDDGKILDVNSLQPAFDEVECAFTQTLEKLAQAENVRSTQFRISDSRLRKKMPSNMQNAYCIPVYLNAPYHIWGLTAVITHQTLRLLLPRSIYNFQPRVVAF